MRFLNYVYVIFLQKSLNFETTYFVFFYFKIFKIRQFKNKCFLIVKTKKTYKFLMFSNDVFNHFLSIHYISSINGHAFCKKFYRIRCKKFYAYSYSYHTCKIGTFSTTFLNFALLYISLQNQAV